MQRQARAAEPDHPVAVRLRELRERLRMTQAELAKRAGLSDRVEVARLENGWNKGSSGAMRQKLAVGLGLSLENTFAYLDGRIDVDTAARLSTRNQAAEG